MATRLVSTGDTLDTNVEMHDMISQVETALAQGKLLRVYPMDGSERMLNPAQVVELRSNPSSTGHVS